MKVLAIDTVTAACSVALSVGKEVIQKYAITPVGQPPIHAKFVLQMVAEVLQESRFSLNNLDVIAVNTGPGSFTGVRIGLGVTQGLAYAADLAVIGVCSLEVLAASVECGMVLPAIDARMNQVYCGLYEVVKNTKPIQRHPPMVVDPSAIPFQTHNTLYGLGSGWDVYGDAIHSALRYDEINVLSARYPEAKQVAQVAQQSGRECAVAPMQLHATYIRNNIASQSTPSQLLAQSSNVPF